MIRRLAAAQSCLLIVDMQATLMPVIDGAADQVAAVDRLARSARALGVPVLATEHVADKLGPTVPPLKAQLQGVHHKTTFNACAQATFSGFIPQGRHQVVMAGAEAHVCVMQTALGLLAAGHEVWVVQDGCGSRHPGDKQAAMTRLAAAGGVLMSAEMVMFEWLAEPAHPAFGEVLAIIKSRDGR